ncbi:spastin [Apiospora rasikravindrae]|uniref:Spastin n=1 Tax=Apiospora rasikravindrae TaxID=990691 RepID=A0ABR1SYH5_9PEZI
MYAPWIRALRSVARSAPIKTRIAAAAPARQLAALQQQRRCLHASTPLRAAAPPPAEPPAGNPNDDKPDNNNNNKDDSEANQDENNLFGENGLNGNGNGNAETQGRQRRRMNGPAARARRRAPEDLPVVQLPESFQKTHVYRSGDAHESSFFSAQQQQQQDPRELALSVVRNLIQDTFAKGPAKTRTQAVAEHVSELVEFMLALKKDSKIVPKSMLGDTAVTSEQENQSPSSSPDEQQSVEAGNEEHTAQVEALASANRICLFTLGTVKEVLEPEIPERPESTEESNGTTEEAPSPKTDFSADLTEAEIYKAGALIEVLCHTPGSTKSSLKSTALRNLLTSNIPYKPYLKLGGLHHQALQEVVSSVRSDLMVECPKSIKTEVRRPVTILDFPYYRGSSWPRHVINDVANEVDANVLHLTAQDLGHIVGPYLGQDISRAAGPCSLLGYNAASHSGRLRLHTQENDERDPESPSSMGFLIFDNLDRSKQNTKKSQTLLEGLLGGGSNREKSDNMWEDLKINTALEHLISAAESDAAEQKPLIVHIHDFNALGLASSAMLNKLRKTVDTLWAEGRKIVLVGSCSSPNAPRPYLDALKYSTVVEHVMILHASDSEELSFLEHEQNDFLEENTNNIKATLYSLLKPSYNGDVPEIRFNMQLIEDADLRASFCSTVLPFSEVYRICKSMIGSRKQQLAAFDQNVLEEALRLVQSIDEGLAGVIKTKRLSDREGRSPKDPFFASPRSAGDPRQENHEERLLSGLVDAKDIRTTFKDVHAPKETIESVRMLTQLSLQRPEAFSYGVLATDRIPGCLLYGPPGTGKTLLAKAVAKESGANMIEVSAASINNMFVGESEKNVRALFSLAKKKEPMVIFIDEADALLGSRGPRNGGNQREVMNQFLREWDGMDTMKAFIMVATNRPFDLDDAVLRRLPRKLLVDLPLENDRAAILRIHLKGETLDENVSIEELAKKTPLYSGSDLKNVCVAAAMTAVKEELEASDKHTGPEPYQWAQKRVLSQRHFDKGLAEISASVSEDMSTMNAIRKFDERYGDGKARKKRKGDGVRGHTGGD